MGVIQGLGFSLALVPAMSPGELDLGIIAKLRLSALSPPELGPVNELPLLGPCLPASVEI